MHQACGLYANARELQKAGWHPPYKIYLSQRSRCFPTCGLLSSWK
jgi:hypothetical protein